jgi:hypothetical protein
VEKADGDEDHVPPFWIKVDYRKDLKLLKVGTRHFSIVVDHTSSIAEGYYNLDFP